MQASRLPSEARATAGPVTAMEDERDMLMRHLTDDPAVAEGLAAFTERREPDFAQFGPVSGQAGPPEQGCQRAGAPPGNGA